MTTAEILRNARAVYAASPAHTPRGLSVPDGCHCLVTALTEATKECRHPAFYDARIVLADAIGTNDLIDWNAERSTDEVLAAFDRAIEAAS